jgi:hypothetical protein
MSRKDPPYHLPDADHVLRYAGQNRLQRNDSDDVIGLLPEAFRLGDGHDSLSVTWVEYFEGDCPERIIKAVQAFRRSMSTGRNSAFGMANVGVVKRLCHDHIGSAVRILHEPEKDNPAHAAIHRYPRGDEVLMELLASEAICQIIMNKHVPESIAEPD